MINTVFVKASGDMLSDPIQYMLGAAAGLGEAPKLGSDPVFQSAGDSAAEVRDYSPVAQHKQLSSVN